MNTASYLSRAQMIVDNLLHCNSGADIHVVTNMRSSAMLLMEQIKNNILEESDIISTLESIEKRQVEYFKTKFGGTNSS